MDELSTDPIIRAVFVLGNWWNVRKSIGAGRKRIKKLICLNKTYAYFGLLGRLK